MFDDKNAEGPENATVAPLRDGKSSSQVDSAAQDRVVAARRRFIKAGAAVVPIVLTMRAAPAYAGGARRYGYPSG